MASQADTGTQSASVSTLHTLSTITASGIYCLSVDINNMILGDVLELSALVKVLTGGTSRQYFLASYAHVPQNPTVISVPIPVLWEVVFKLRQTAGSGRSFPWEVIRLDA